MIAYKGFRPGMICIDYQFQMGLNVTEKANCRQNGFHCAEDPLDCLSYYGDVDHSEYYIVNAGGDIDEDEVDSKISCTELTVLKRLTKEELFLHGLAFMADHPKRKWNKHIRKDRAEAWGGYAVTYNDLCRKCQRTCKQSFRAVIVDCPHYLSKRSKRKVKEDTD